jgi:hypothetical protein
MHTAIHPTPNNLDLGFFKAAIEAGAVNMVLIADALGMSPQSLSAKLSGKDTETFTPMQFQLARRFIKKQRDMLASLLA